MSAVPTGRARGAVRAAALGAALAGALAMGCARSRTLPAGAGGGEAYVVLLSFDGVGADYLDRGDTPNLARLARSGVRAAGLVPGFPSKTFPNHYAIATGVRADRHGIVGNEFYDPAWRRWYRISDTAAVRDGRWYGGEPIWAAAERQGARTASMLWPGGEAEIGGVRPSRYKRFAESGTLPNEARADTLLAWLALPPAERPRLVLGYFSAADEAGHRYGPDAPETRAVVRDLDRALGRLLDGISRLPVRDRVSVVVVSDHGMSAVRGWEVPAAAAPLDGVTVQLSGPVGSLWFGGDSANLARTEARLAAGLRHTRVFRRGALPSRLRASVPRMGDLVLVAEPGYVLLARAPSSGAAPGGQHGWDAAEVPEMHGVLLAAGPRLRPGVSLPTVDNVSVHPLVAELLGIRPAAGVEGTLAPFAAALRTSR